MTDDDRDLSRRLSAIDEAPRPSWVADLRAELAASYEVGELPRPLPIRAPRGRRFPALTLTLGAAAAVALLLVAAIWHPTSTPPQATVPAPSTTEVAGPAPSQVATTIPPPVTTLVTAADAAECDYYPPLPASNFATSVSSLWSVKYCYDDTGWQGIEIAEIDTTSGRVVTSQRVTSLHFSESPAPTMALRLIGVAQRRALFTFDFRPFVLDVDSGLVTYGSPGGREVGLAGNVVIMTSLDGIDTLDLGSGTTRRIQGGAALPEQATSASDSVWLWSTHTADIVRVDADGSTHRLERFTGSIYPSGVVAAPGTLWVAIEDPDEAFKPSFVRVDRDDGHALSPAVPLPEGSQPGNTFTTVHASTQGLLITDPASGWWWIDNDGNIAPLGKPSGEFIAVVDDRILVLTPANEIVSYSVTELAALAT